MALIWGLAIPLPAHLGLLLFGFLVCGTWMLFSTYQSQKQVAAKTETSKHHKLKKIQKPTDSQLEESPGMEFIEADLTCISGFSMTWTQEYLLWSIDRSLRQIFQHLENARASLMELSLPESQDMASSSTSSDLMAQDVVLPRCYCKKTKHPTNYSSSSGSSNNNNSSLSYFPIFPERTTWQFRSNSVPISSSKQPSVFSSQGTSLPPFQLTDTEKTELLMNLAAFSPLQSQNSFISSILESPSAPCQQQETTKDKRMSKSHLVSDHGKNSVLHEQSAFPDWAPLWLSPLTRGKLEGHMSQKVSTLREQRVPLPVKKSWAMMVNDQMEVPEGVPEPVSLQTPLPTPILQNAEQNINNKSQDLPSSHLHVNIGMDSGLHGTETKFSPSHISVKQLQSRNAPQILASKPLVMSMGTPPPRYLGSNIIQEETTLLKKDPKHVLELSIEQRVIGLPEKRIQPHKTQVTNVELTPRQPYQATDSIKITPLALLQVMDSMGMIPESHSEVIESVSFFPQPPNQVVKPVETMGTVSVTPKPSHQVIESVKVISSPQHQVTESKTMTSTLSEVTDNVKVTPVALLHAMDSMGMLNKLHPHVIKSHCRPQRQVLEPVKRDTLLNHQAIKPGKTSPRPQHMVMETVKMIPEQKHNITESVNTTSGSQNQVMEQVKITPGPLHQATKSMGITSTPLRQVMDYTQATPGILQAMNFMGTIPPVQPHFIKPVTPGLQYQVAHLIPMSTQPDGLTSNSSIVAPLEAVESVSLLPKLPPEITESADMILTPSHQPIHALKVTPVAQGSPVEMIISPQPQVVQSHSLIPQPMSQVKESLAWPSGLQVQILDSLGMTPQYQDTLISGSFHQAIDPLRLTSWHQALDHSEMVPRKSHAIKTIGLTSDTWPQIEKPIELSESYHQIMESLRTIPGSPGQGTEPIEKSQKPLQDTECEVVSTTSSLQSMKYIGMDSMLQLPAGDSMTLSPGSQDIKSENLIMNPRLQSMKSPAPIDLIPSSQFQGMKYVHLDLPQEFQDIKTMELAPIPPLQDIKSIELAPKPCLQNTSSDKIFPAQLLEDAKTAQMVESGRLTPEAQVPSMRAGEQEVKSAEVNPTPSYQTTESAEVTSWHKAPEAAGMISVYQAAEAKLTSDTCHVEESVALTQSPLGVSPVPLSQISESMERSSITFQNTLETKPQVVKEMGETPESQNTIKDTSNVLQESEVQSIKPEMLVPESQPPDTKFAHLNLGPCSEGTKLLEIPLRSEYENTETVGLTLPQVDKTQGATPEPYLETGSLELHIGGQYKKSESLLQNLKSVELISESSLLVVGSRELTTGHKPCVKDLTPSPQLEGIKSRQMDPETELHDEKSVNVIQKSATETVVPEKPKSEPGLLSMPLKELTEGTQLQSVKSMNLNLGPQQPSVKCALTPGPQLQTVRFSKLFPEIQGEQPVTFTSVPLQYSVKSDEMIPGLPVQENTSSDFIPGPKHQNVKFRQLISEPQLQCMKSMELNSRPSLKDVKFSDMTPEPKHQGFRYIQLIPGHPLQDIESQEFVPESFLQLSQEPQVDDMSPVRPMGESEFHSMKSTKQASELLYQGVISEEVNLSLRQQDIISSELASGPKLQGVKFGDKTPGSMLHGMNSVEGTRELWLHDPKLEKMSLGLPHTKQVSLNSGPWLQDVRFFDLASGSRPQGMICKLTPEPQLEDMTSVALKPRPLLGCMPSMQLTPKPEMGQIKSMMLTPGPQAGDMKPGDLILGSKFKGAKSESLPSGSQSEDMKPVGLLPEQHLEGMKSMARTPRSQLKGVKSVKLIPHLRHQDLKTVGLLCGSQVQDVNAIEYGPKRQDKNSVAFSPGPLLQVVKSMEMLHRPQLKGMKLKELTSEPQIQDTKSVAIMPCLKQKSLKFAKETPDSQLQCGKSMKITPKHMKQLVKSVDVIGKQGVKPVDLAPKQQFQGMAHVDLTLGPGQDTQRCVSSPEWECVNFNTLKRGNEKENMPIPELKFQGIKPTDLNSKLPLKGMKTLELAPEQLIQDVKVKGFKCKPRLQRKSHTLTPGSQSCQVKPLESTLEPQLQDVKTMELNKEAKPGYTKSVQWLPRPRFQGEKLIGLNFKSQPQGVTSAELKQFLELGVVKSSEFIAGPKLQGAKSMEFNLEPQLQQAQTSKLSLESELQKRKISASTSEPQLGSTKSIQWIPGPDFQGVKSLGLHFGLQCQCFKPVELKPSIQLGCVNTSEMTLGSKCQGKKSKEINFGPQVQHVKTPELSPELQKGEISPSISESQLQGVETVELHQEAQLGNMKSIQWIPVPNFQVMKSMLNLGLQSQGVTAAKLNPSMPLRDVETSELTPRPKLQGGQLSVQERQPHGFKPIVPKSGLRSKSLRSCDSTSRSKLSDIKSMMFQPRFNLQDSTSPELDPGLRLQKANASESSLFTPFQGMKPLVFPQEPQLSGMKSRMSSKGPLLQEGQIIELISSKSSELALQTQRRCMKSGEFNPESQWQRVKYSKLTPKTKSQYMKYTKLSPSSQLKGIPFADLTMGSKLPLSVKKDFKPGPQMQGRESSEPILMTKPPTVKSVERESGPQLHDLKSSRMIMGIQLQDVKSMDFSPRPHFQCVGSSEVIPEKKLQGVKPIEPKCSTKLQSEKSELTPRKKFLGMKSGGLDSGIHLQDKKSSGPQILSKKTELIQGKKLKNVNSVEFSHNSKLQGVTPELTSEAKLQDMESLKFNSGPQLQDVKYSKLILGTKLQDVKALGFSLGPHSQSMESSEVIPETKLHKGKPVDLMPQPPQQDGKSFQLTELVLGTEHPGAQSLKFNPGPHLQGVNSSASIPGQKPQCANSTGWNPGLHLQGVNSSACTLGPQIQCANSTGCNPRPHLQGGNSPACTPDPQIQCINSTGCNPRPHLQGVNSSACTLGPQIQCVNSTGCNPGPYLQGVNSSICTPGPQIQCANSTGCNPGPHSQGMNTPVCAPDPQIQCINSTECNPGPHLQGVNSSICTPGPQIQCANSAGCNPGPHLQGMNSVCSPGPQIQCINSAGCNPRPHLQGVNSSACTPGPQIPCVNSTEFNPGPHLQGVKLSESTDVSKLQVTKSFELNPETEIKKKMSIIINSAQQLQDLKFELTPESKFLGITPINCNPGPQVQCVNFSELNPGSKLQCMNSMECKFGPYLQGIKPFELTSETKPQGVRSSELQPVPKLQGIDSVVQHLQDIKCELTPGTEFQNRIPMDFNSGPQFQGINSSELNPESKLHCINSIKLRPGPQVQNMKPSELNPESESQGTKSVLFNSGPHLQGVKFSDLMLGAKLQGVPFLENQLGSQQQTAQPVFPLGSQSNDMKSMVVFPEPLLKDVTSMEMSKQSLLCGTNAVKLTPGFGMQVFTVDPCFQNVKSVQLKPGPHPNMDSLGLASCLRSPCVKSVVFAPKPCFRDIEPMELRLGSQEQSMDCKKLALGWHGMNPVVLASDPTRKFLSGPALTSVKFSNWVPESQQQGVKSLLDFAPESKWQSVKHVKLSSVSLQQTVKSVELLPKSLLQSVKPGNQVLQTNDQFTESSEVIHRPGHQLVEYADMIPKAMHQIPKSMNLISVPIYQTTGSSEITKELVHQNMEPVEKFVKLFPKPTRKATESPGMPLQLDLQVPEFVALTPVLRDQGSKPLELTPKKSDQVPETLKLLSHSWPQFKDLTYEARLQEKGFVSMAPKPVSQMTEYAEKTQRPCPQDLQPEAVVSENRPPREESVVLTPTSSHPVPDSASEMTLGLGHQIPESMELISKESMGWTPKSQHHMGSSGIALGLGHRLPESVQVISKQWPQMEESLKLSPKLTNQVVEKMEAVDCTSETRQQGMVASGRTQPQDPRMKTSGIGTLGEVGECPRTQLQVAQSVGVAQVAPPEVAEYAKMTPGPLHEVVTSATMLEPDPQRSKYDKLTPKLQNVSFSELTSSLWLQNVKSKNVITQPTQQILKTTELSGFQIIKTVLIPGPLLWIVKSEKLAPGPVPQVVEPIGGVATGSAIEVTNCLNLLPRPHLPTLIQPSGLQDFGIPEVSGALDMKNLGINIFQPPGSYSDPIMIQSSALPSSLHNRLSDETVNTVETTYPEIWAADAMSKEGTTKKHLGELEESLQNPFSYPPQSWRSSSENFQPGSGARRGPIRSFLSRQQNIWESHACRQRLPRKYLSTMLMLGNVLGTTMERKLCSQTRLTEGASEDNCQYIQNLFGVPAELMEFSQTLLENGPTMTSQTSVIKNYIQRHTLSHGYEKRMAIRMWTRGSTSSIIRQYSGTRLGIKKTNSKLSNTFQEVTQHTPVSGTGGQFSALVKSEPSLRIIYNREDPVSTEECENSQGDMHARTFESQHSFKPSSFSQAKTDFSEQLHVLQDLQLKIAAKLLRSQIPPNLPPPLASGLVLKYPICLQCGRCLGFNCCHKLQSTCGPYLLIYPQLHLVSTPEGHGEIRLHLGFRLRTGKKTKVSKHRGRDRSDIRRLTVSPSQRKTKVYAPPSKSPTPTQDFQSESGSSQSPTPVQVHIRQRQGSSPDVVGKTEIEDLAHDEFHRVHSSESDFESNQDEKWTRVQTKKTSDIKYTMKRIPKGLGIQNTKLYTNSRASIESTSQELPAPLGKNSGTAQTSPASLKRQSKKSSQPKLMQLLFQGLRQAFQTAHRIIAFTGQKPGGKAKLDNLWSSKNNHPKQKARNYCLATESRGDRMPVIKPSPTGSIKQNTLWGTRAQCRSAPQSKEESSLQPKPLQFPETTVFQTNKNALTSSTIQPLGTVQNDIHRAKSIKFCSDEFSSQEDSKNFPKEEPRVQGQGRILSGSLLKRTLYGHFKEKHPHKDRNQHSFFKGGAPHTAFEPSLCGPFERPLPSLSGRSHRSTPERSLRGGSERRHRSPRRKPRSLSERGHHSPSEGRCHSPSKRRPHSPSERRRHSPLDRSSRSTLDRSSRSPSERCPSPSKRSHRSPSERSYGSLSDRSPCSPSGRKGHSSSGRTHHSPSDTRQLRPSAKNHRGQSEKSRHGHSERTRRGHSERMHPSPKEIRKHSSHKERPRHGLSREFKSYSNMSPRDHTKDSGSWTSLEAGS